MLPTGETLGIRSCGKTRRRPLVECQSRPAVPPRPITPHEEWTRVRGRVFSHRLGPLRQKRVGFGKGLPGLGRPVARCRGDFVSFRQDERPQRLGSRSTRRCNCSCRHHKERSSATSEGGGPRSSGSPTRTGLNRPRQGAAVPVTQCECRLGDSSQTQLAVVCEAAVTPPACIQGALMAPLSQE